MSGDYYIGLMSGTSLDGIDAALVNFSSDQPTDIQTLFLPYPPTLKKSLLALHKPIDNELEHAQLTANTVTKLYADAVNQLIIQSNTPKNLVAAIGAHGQTIRHRPELGFSLQLINSALLAELTQITVTSDFRSRDIAAGGQGAPLVPAFHQAIFANQEANRAIVNIGGIANVTYLPINGTTSGFDTGPGNLLLDHWTQLKLEKPYDKNGDWAKSGKIIEPILSDMLADPYFTVSPPKSTGRDLFNANWLKRHILYPHCKSEDIARTLVEFSAVTIVEQCRRFCDTIDETFVCGGGAHNTFLLDRIDALSNSKLETTTAIGISPDWVEAIAFAWLAKQCINQTPSNLPGVTGAAGPRILGTMTFA